ncbi:MAG: glycosyltransferase family 2 protein [Verrucomicrobiota bacterium]
MSKLISIVIPCYNEESVLPLLYERLHALVATWSDEVEIICVNDGSRDQTWIMLEQIAHGDPQWKAVCLSRNFGHQAAVSAGMYHAKGDCVCIIDADLQDPPQTLEKFIEAWKAGSDVVYGVRKQRKDTPLKKLFAWCFYRVIGRLVSIQIPPDSGDFCLLDRKVVDVMNSLPERNRYLRGLRVWCGFKHTAVAFDRDARAAGEPQYTFKKSFRLAMDGIFSFSAVPLALASHIGLWVSGFALCGMLFTLAQRFFHTWFASIGLEPGPGFATIVISILFLGGVQLICLGILGEYLGRIYDEVKGRPAWVISKLINFESNQRN